MGLGQYPWGSQLRIEQYAYNLFGSRGKGYKPIVLGGPERVVLDARLSVVDGTVLSENPGRFVCNYSMYQIMRQKDQATKFGFIHIPRKVESDKAMRIVKEILAKSGVQ